MIMNKLTILNLKKLITRFGLLACWVCILIPSVGYTDELDSGDTAWMLTASALVLFMTLPGLALFYGGLVRSKNILSVLAQCIAIAGIATLVWVVCGYSLAFGEPNAFWGGFGNMFLIGITVDSVSGTIPESLFIMFQATFAIITPALIVGAFTDRMKFSSMSVFSALWLILVYAPICHNVWGGGYLSNFGIIDFAGGTVVHINAGIAALVACLVIGPRIGYPRTPMPPHNLALSFIGACMLWIGWFGFNAGSELAADGVAAMAMLVTQVATAAAALTWALMEKIFSNKASLLGMITGAVAGLVAITPASGSVGPLGAIAIGIASGVLCYFASTSLKRKLGYDDSLDVFGVHGVGGIVGAILTGVFSSATLGGSGIEGTIGSQVLAQMIGVIVTIIYCGIVSYIILKVIDKTMGLRVSEEQESDGLDITLHGERGYNLD
jgi:Amt family ammonium transporter|tara:strand:+ start:245 stop:1561 length:1317 start_codon:yes stop_codon:yes gene_type:complete